MTDFTGHATAVKGRVDRDGLLLVVLLVAYSLFFLLTVIVPLGLILLRSFQDRSGKFVGLANWQTYFSSSSLVSSFGHSFLVATVTTAIVLVLGFAYAYALCRTRMPWRPFFKIMAMAPLLMPGLLKAIALIYWFGNQGVLKEALMGASIYGPIGIVMASTIWTLPHAILVLSAAMMLSDARLFEAAACLRAGPLRTFLTVTLPGVRYGLISTGIFVFIRVFTDFAIPKVIGGSYNVLATDIYKEVVGQQNFEMGAVVSMMLLVPALLAFIVDRAIAGGHGEGMTARAVPHEPKPSRIRDTAYFVYCATIAFMMLAVIVMGQLAALFRFWPYNLSLTLDHYTFDMQGVGWDNFRNSLVLSIFVATIGAALSFVSAYLVEKPLGHKGLRGAIHAVALMPMAIPGLVLGLGYLLFINTPGNPLGFLYGTISILVINTISLYYTVPHLTARTALRQIDREFEAVAASLKMPLWRNFFRVTMPICLPAILDIWVYLFLSAMTTVSGVIFLYGIHSSLASLAVVHMDEAGRLASAAAMGTLILYACVLVRLVHVFVARGIILKTQKWRAQSHG
jgi:iron(III) transport system permease protein